MLDHLAVLKGFTQRAERRDLVEHLLQLTNLWDVRKRALGTLSGGMRQRFGIAQALIGDPRLVVVDEPTAGLDPEERYRFLSLLTEIGDGVVLVLSTHIVDDVSDVCQGMAILADGRVRAQGEPRTIVETLRGTIWRKPVTREELAALRRDLTVLGTRWHAGRLVAHVSSPSAPGVGFEPAPPDLHDLYLHTLGHDASAA
jgi:ABC-type multidrug transport system ATPase subunit